MVDPIQELIAQLREFKFFIFIEFFMAKITENDSISPSP